MIDRARAVRVFQLRILIGVDATLAFIFTLLPSLAAGRIPDSGIQGLNWWLHDLLVIEAFALGGVATWAFVIHPRPPNPTLAPPPHSHE